MNTLTKRGLASLFLSVFTYIASIIGCLNNQTAVFCYN